MSVRPRLLASARAAAAAVGLVAGLGLAPAPRALAEESRFNLHLQLGPTFVVDQPLVRTTSEVLAIAGLDLRFGIEFEPHERFGVELLYDATLLFDQSATLAAQQAFLVGARFRPWYAREGGYLWPRTQKPLVFLNDILSDAWIDAHLGVSLASRNRFVYDVGVGARMAVIWPVQVGLFVRYQQLLALGGADETSFKQVVAGFELDAGFQPVHAEPDGDDDGVPDARDRCPDTPRGAVVNAVGCPVGQEPTAPGPQCADEDLDGVCDGEDQCPDTAYGVQVDGKGCPAEGSGSPAAGDAGDADPPPAADGKE